jgi:hypothetical protein
MNQPASDGERGEKHRAAEEIAPVAIGGEPGEGEIARPEELGQEIDRHALEHRDREKEHHDGAVHGEDLGVEALVHERACGGGKLRADQHREQAADGEEESGRVHEALAEHGVVDCGQAGKPRRGAPDRFQRLMEPDRMRGLFDLHSVNPRSSNAVKSSSSCAST